MVDVPADDAAASLDRTYEELKPGPQESGSGRLTMVWIVPMRN